MDVTTRFFMTLPEKKEKNVHHKRASERLRDSSKVINKEINYF